MVYHINNISIIEKYYKKNGSNINSTLIYVSSAALYPSLKLLKRRSVIDLIPVACTDNMEVMKPA